jgi:thymidylate synthase (FAD)
MIDKEFKVLDKGFIRLVDYMGSDQAIVQAARVSYGKGTKTKREDEGLIRYLMRHRHTTPFEQCELKFHVKVPMDCWRQWIRHRTASVNEYSTRYSEAIDDKQETNEFDWRKQDTTKNTQGSSELYLPVEGIASDGYPQAIGKWHTIQERALHKTAETVYKNRLKDGIAREQARKDLPLSTYTMAYWKIDLHNLFHFLGLRMDSHAQLEIRKYANIIGYEIVAKLFPLAWGAFLDYRLNAMTLSARDTHVIQQIKVMYGDKYLEESNDYNPFNWLEKRDDGTLKDNLERKEFEEKAKVLGIKVPWI